MGISNKVYPFDLTGWFGPPRYLSWPPIAAASCKPGM
jgi:hypothetical protein